MPQITDFLVAPWKIFGLLFSSAQHTGAPDPSHPGFCYVQNAGDQALNVCRVGAYEMPSFIFAASILILAFFLLASATLYFQCVRLSFVIGKIASSLEKIRIEARTITGKELSEIRSVMEKHPFTATLWSRFEDTLLISEKGERIYSTESAEAIFSKSALIEENVHTSLFNSVPGILTGVGLLMTFVAILDGLSHVTVAANMDVKGIGGLINGLSGKFVSSIVAVSCAVLFVFVERIAYSAPLRSYRRLIAALASRFKRRTTEHLLHEMQEQIQEQLKTQAEIIRELRIARAAEPVSSTTSSEDS